MNLKDFRIELRKRGISDSEVPRELMSEGRILVGMDRALPVYKDALTKVGQGATVGVIGGLLINDKKPIPSALVGATLGGAFGGYLHNRNYIKNGRMKGILREEFLNNYSDMSKDQGEVNLPTETDGDTKMISKNQSDLYRNAKRILGTKTGKVILSGIALATIAAIAKPRITVSLRKKNTQEIDTSEYLYTDDGTQVLKCIATFNDFLSRKDILQSVKVYKYDDIEKIYLDTLDAIDRSSPRPESDKDYITTIWEAIYSFYDTKDVMEKLDGHMRINPNKGSIFIR